MEAKSKVNVKFFTAANGETGYSNHARSFWSRLQTINDNVGVPINIVLETSQHPMFYKNYDGIKICYNVYESTLQPESFFNHIKNNWDYFWCPSEWQRQCMIDQGFPAERIHVVPEGVDGKEFFPVADKDLAEEFTFIIVGKWEYRKATEEMINAWLEEFPLESYPTGLRLILSVDNPFDKENVDHKINTIKNLNDPRITFVHFPPRNEYIKLLQTSHVFLSCSRSEGWGLPLIEAIACGIPSICTNYSAQIDFANNIAHMVNIKEMRPIPTGFPGEYAEPDFEHFKSLMRYIFENWNECRQKALMGASYIRQKFSWENAVEIAKKYLLSIDDDYKSKETNVAPVSAKINITLIDGIRFEMSGDNGLEYLVKFIDNDHNSVIYSTKMKLVNKDNVCWAAPNAKFFVNWKIEVKSINNTIDNKYLYDDDTIILKGGIRRESLSSQKEEEFIYKLDLKDKRVFINLESRALGDNLAWIPYVEEFRQKWGCKIICTTFWNNLFIEQYPEIEFVKPGTVVDNLYAQYRVGCYDNDNTRNKFNWREVPLQKVAADALGLKFSEIKPKVTVNVIPRTGRKYVCISDHSTMQCKYWNHPGGWQQVINYLSDLGYDVVAVSKDPTGLTKTVPINNKTIEETISIINNCEFFVGVGSGLSWLAWALGKKVIMISGFSDPFTEFISDNYRLAPPPKVCHGCFNDVRCNFDRSWNWCPRNKDYECSKMITPEMVKEKIDLLISHL